MAGCDHETLRLVTLEEEPNIQERARRPWTCDDCQGPAPARFTQYQVQKLFLDRLRALEAWRLSLGAVKVQVATRATTKETADVAPRRR